MNNLDGRYDILIQNIAKLWDILKSKISEVL